MAGSTIVQRVLMGATVCLASLLAAGSAKADSAMPSETPSSAEAFQPGALARKVLNLDTVFNWIGTTDRFWFRYQPAADQEEFIIVDAATGKRSSFPTQDALYAELGPNAPSDKGADLVVSPDRASAVFRRGDDLWLRTFASGAERQLTRDGVRDFGYGDLDRWEDLEKVARRRNHLPTPLRGVLWSPNGRYIVALRQDMRPFPERVLVTEYTPPDKGDAQVHMRRIATARDARRPDSHLVAIDTTTWEVRPIELDPQALNDWAFGYYLSGVVWWNGANDKLYVISGARGGARFGLDELDLTTGRVREILNETAPIVMRLNQHDYYRPNVHVLASGKEAIWYSERDGYGHLYLYEATSGTLKRQLTRGNWVVFDLLHVDESRRLAYFAAGPRNGGNPYYRYLYRVSLDGGEPKLLTPEVADHNFHNYFGVFRPSVIPGSRVSPSGRYFVDGYSTTDQPPRVVIRRTSGELVKELFKSDASALYASGWTPPERIVVKAADGTTDLYGVIARPKNFDPAKKYPVIDYMYPGPQLRVGPRSFADDLLGHFEKAQVFADAGFIVVTVDGRGTANRSRAFRDAFLRTEDAFGAVDHVAAVRNLAAQRPYMDLDRVGVMGHSYGGYGSLRAMLLHPDFFKVGVSTVGPGEWFSVTHPVSIERVFGVPTESARAREYFDIASNTRLAPRLKGRVMLMYGGIDENVPLTDAFIVFDAFIKADKDIDMLVIPDSPHGVFGLPYAVRRGVQYFVDHLVTPEASH